MKVDPGNHDQYTSWNGEGGERWVDSADRRDAMWAPVADALMAAAGPEAGERVLDLGCGCGVTTLAAARAVTPTGTAVGVDLSAARLDVARTRAAAAGLDNATFEQVDVQAGELPLANDLVLARFGTMFYADPAAAFSNVARSMSSHGRLCVVTWQPLLDNEWIVVPGGVLLRYGSMPEGGAGSGPGMFAQSDPDLVTDLLTAAGFCDVRLDPVTVRVCLGDDVDAALTQIVDFGPGREVLATVPDTERTIALEALAAALEEHADDDGVHLGASIWLVHACLA